MFVFKRLMIALDLTIMDQTLITYASFLSRLMDPEHILFLNIQPELELPEELAAEFSMLPQNPEEKIQEEIHASILAHFPDYEQFKEKIDYEVVAGSAKKKLINYAHNQEVDLLIMGRKAELRGSGVIPSQVARKANCSVLFVPEEAKPSLSHILIGTDFSDHSAQAVKEALELRERYEGEVSVTLQHSYQVPLGYYKTGRTEGQFAALMEKHATERLRAFVDKHEIDLKEVSMVYSFDKQKKSPAHIINKLAHERAADMIVIAARGHSALTAFFLGSVAEKLVNANSDIPLLLSKNTSREVNFFDALGNL